MSYQYDERDRLIKVILQDGSEVTYRYDGDNLLTERIVAGKVTRYYYDEDQIIAEGKVQSDGSVIETVSYLRGNALAMLEETDGTKGYYLLNGHGDVISILGENGEKLSTYDYDIWGNPLINQEQVTNSFLYSGELWDEVIELQYLRARWYDPGIGRFITKDTFEGDLNDPLSLNLYTYVINNPLKYIDPTGNDKLPNAQIGGAGGSRVVGLNTKGSTSKSTTTNNNSKTTNNKTSSSGNTANNSESLRQELSSSKGKGNVRKTSQTFGQPNETVYGGQKVKLRVDAEPDGNKIQIQAGKGKDSTVDIRINPNAPLEEQIPKNLKKSLSESQYKELLKNLQKAVDYLR